ncbi:DUF3127 domain-containing protein [uncultured Porphyromonas sp.]|uniref:DUF3127 domain-containing protein n=1 Tax=uncultured Porphyromonas sp. TaxID=159274 RepID=UPI0026178C2C|nr:DUF3127 domain-containing protein [uncultured Porphyromonas sp.]
MNGMTDNLNTLSGKVIKILPLVEGDSKHKPGEKWYRQEFVIETYAQYPRQVCFQIWGKDRIDAANLQLGEDITVTFELSSREYMERWYTSADARNIMKGMPQQQGFGMPQQGYSMPQQQQSYGAPQQGFGTPQQGNAQMPGTNAPFGPQQGGGDDLPF